MKRIFQSKFTFPWSLNYNDQILSPGEIQILLFVSANPLDGVVYEIGTHHLLKNHKYNYLTNYAM